MGQSDLCPEFVEFIPERLNERILYISRRYRTASHLCCCGCGLEVVTPLNPAKWGLTEHPDGTVSLWPSIGSWSFPCQSHYFVTKNHIQWAAAMSPEQIAIVRLSDRHDAARLRGGPQTRWARFCDALQRGRIGLVTAITRMWSR
jgi:hypothetical protein